MDGDLEDAFNFTRLEKKLNESIVDMVNNSPDPVPSPFLEGLMYFLLILGVLLVLCLVSWLIALVIRRT